MNARPLLLSRDWFYILSDEIVTLINVLRTTRNSLQFELRE